MSIDFKEQIDSFEEKIKSASLSKMVKIFKEQFNMRVRYPNSISIEYKKNLIVENILKKSNTNEIKKTIMDTYFKK